MSHTRRQFLGVTIAGAAVLTAGCSLFGPDPVAAAPFGEVTLIETGGVDGGATSSC